MAYLILVATIPAGLIGFFFESLIKKTVRSPWVVTNLVLVGALFIVGEAVGLKETAGLQAQLPGGGRDRSRPGGGARLRHLPFGGDHHLGAFSGPAQGRGRPVFLLDERARNHRRGVLEPR